MIRLFFATLSLASFLLVFGLVGASDYETEQLEADYYTSMVCEGHWPDYEQRNPVCEVK